MAESRPGIVVERDTAKCRVRVTFPDHSGMISYWLPVLQRNSLKNRDYAVPDIGEHVVCLVDDNAEQGYVVGAFFSDADPAPADDGDLRTVVFEDGAVESYDRRTHHRLLDLTACGGTFEVRTGTSTIIVRPGSIVIRADRIDYNDDR